MRVTRNIRLWITTLFIVTLVSGAMAQSVTWKKDYITDDRGVVIATAAPQPSDQTAPTVPTSLTVDPSGVTLTSARLEWGSSTDNTGGAGLAGYKIYRGNLPVAAVTGTSYTDFDLQPNITYQFKVVAFDFAGNHSGPSNTVSVTPTAPPAAPTNLTAAAVSATQIDLTWTDNSNNETGFKIERRIGQTGTWSQIDTVGANVTTYSDSALTGSTTYYYRIKASAGSVDSPFSNEASATTIGPPAAPTNLTAAAVSATQIDLTWTDNSTTETGFKIERRTGATGTWSQIDTAGANVTGYADSALTPDTTYSIA